MRTNIFVATTLAGDPHTEGIHQAAKIARLGGIDVKLLPPSDSLDSFCQIIKEVKPAFVGMSYRLTPEVGCAELEKAVNYLFYEGVIKTEDNVKICFAGLPQTIDMLRERVKEFPLKVELVAAFPEIMDRARETVEFFGLKNQEQLLAALKEELLPQGIKLLDQLADEVVRNDDYKNEPPLRIPSDAAMTDYTLRIKESPIPVLRTHFGIPDSTILPTVEGIRQIAEARVVDEISLGSSDLSQRYFGQPEMFERLKNDGGVPYKSAEDLRMLFLATRYGNYPSLKPYCHVRDLVAFVKTCIDCGLLRGAHQAVPLFWFNEMDGRGAMTVRESIYEHFDCVRELVKYGIPVEMNDPNQWSSRLAHDTLIATSYALICSVMSVCGVRDMVFQMQMNKPKEVGDFADLAKMGAALDLINQLKSQGQRVYIETRTGIESLSPDMNKAKWQLGRSTLLQMCMNPQIIHIVSYCEANYAARPEDIIDSSQLIRRAVKIFQENKNDILRELDSPIIAQRREHLVNEAKVLYDRIAQEHPNYHKSRDIRELLSYVANPGVLATAVEKHIFTAPGVINPKYKGNFLTKVMKYGMIDLVDNYTQPRTLSEKERLIM